MLFCYLVFHGTPEKNGPEGLLLSLFQWQEQLAEFIPNLFALSLYVLQGASTILTQRPCINYWDWCKSTLITEHQCSLIGSYYLVLCGLTKMWWIWTLLRLLALAGVWIIVLLPLDLVSFLSVVILFFVHLVVIIVIDFVLVAFSIVFWPLSYLIKLYFS